MKKLFGTDGIRGVAGEFPLNPATVRVIGTSLARRLRERSGSPPRIVTGRDTRESGPWIEQALIEGAREADAEIETAGVITTPGVAYLTRVLPADAGVVISASHNPYHDNGIKVFEPMGRKLDDAMEGLIEADVAAQMNEEGKGEEGQREIGSPLPLFPFAPSDPLEEQLRSRYLDYLVTEIGGGLSLTNLKIIVDCANGSAYEIAPEVFRRLGALVVAVNDQPDGRNINLNCGSLHIEELQKRVVAERANLGVAFDGDADRALFVDASGQFVDGDATLWLLANYFHARNELTGDTVVVTVMSNVGLEIALKSQGITLVRTDVGDKYVLDELLRSGAALGGEQSGHVMFPKISLAGDGIITTLMLLRVVVEKHHSLAELTSGFRRYPQLLVNVPVCEKRPFEELPSVQLAAREIEAKLSGRGRLLLRYSGTEPLARVMIEGENEEEVRECAELLADAIRREIGTGQK